MAGKQQAYLSDEQIIDLYFAREERAIAETNAKYGAYLHTVAFNILSNEQDAEECLQDTYLRVWNAVPPERPQIFPAFLVKITRNLSLHRYEREHRQKRVPMGACVPLEEVQEFLPGTCDADAELHSMSVMAVINAYLQSTTKRRLYIFISRYFFSLSVSQIAKRLCCSQTLVRREIAAIRRELRERLQEEGITV